MTLIFGKTYKPMALQNVIYLLYFFFLSVLCLKDSLLRSPGILWESTNILKYLKMNFSVIAALALNRMFSFIV